MSTYLRILNAFVIMMLVCCPLFSQTTTTKPCPRIVGMLVTQFIFRTPLTALPRVEIRQCGEDSETLQIVAWEAGNRSPSLILDTTDFTVVQSVARGDIYIIETTGGSRDRIYVIMYKGGKPKLELMRVTKDTARITIDADFIEVIIPGIYAGDAEPRIERHRFNFK